MLRSIENQTLDPSFCLQQQTEREDALGRGPKGSLFSTYTHYDQRWGDWALERRVWDKVSGRGERREGDREEERGGQRGGERVRGGGGRIWPAGLEFDTCGSTNSSV